MEGKLLLMCDVYLCPHCGDETDKKTLAELGLCVNCSDKLQNDIYGVNTPLDFQSIDHEQRFFKPR